MLRHYLPRLENEQRRNRRDLVVRGQWLIVVDVHLADFVVPGQRLNGRTHRPGRSAPGGPKIDEAPSRRLEFLFFPVKLFQEHNGSLAWRWPNDSAANYARRRTKQRPC